MSKTDPTPPEGFVAEAPPDFSAITTDDSMWQQLTGRNVLTNLFTPGLDTALLLRQATEGFLLFEYQDGDRVRQLAWSRAYVKSVEFITGYYTYVTNGVPGLRVLYHGCLWLDHNEATVVQEKTDGRGGGFGIGAFIPMDGGG
ncbi:MAG: hypothetical protein GY826_09150 [Fuerstiella sp.]|nr:hypothetical protein [Fuerstiella sp.]